LNLDIFGVDASQSGKHKEVNITEKANKSAAAESVAPRSSDGAVPDAKDASPRFVPVGFYDEHLRLLDEAVFALRKQGFRQASKSAIIRRLIEIHRDELPRIYLDGGFRS
jgi:hypothetical protein